MVKTNQDNDLNDKKLTNFDSVTVNREPNSDNELANQKNIDYELHKNTILRFNQTLKNYLQVSVGNDAYNLTKYDKIQTTDSTVIRVGNNGSFVLPLWKIICNNKNNNGKMNNFIKTTRTISPTSQSGATILPPIGDSFMYIETSGDNHGDGVYVSFERTDILQITNITFYYNRFSILTFNSLKSMGRFRIQLLLDDNTWSTRYNIPKKDRYSDNSTEWILVSLIFSIELFGFKLFYDQIDTANADMCFSNITITHSVF